MVDNTGAEKMADQKMAGLKRIYWMDNLRTFMIFLVVVLHSGIVYESTGFGGLFWIVYDFSTNRPLPRSEFIKTYAIVILILIQL